tara:strand:+ start:747 stop:1013 length:267 start_codon:yes stop_codon:yes gene_type:complete
MKTIPILKTILASLAFAINNWQKLLEVSIFPLLMMIPFITILPEVIVVMQAQLLGNGEIQANPIIMDSIYYFLNMATLHLLLIFIVWW